MTPDGETSPRGSNRFLTTSRACYVRLAVQRTICLRLLSLALLSVLVGCGARTSTLDEDPIRRGDGGLGPGPAMDAGPDASLDAGPDAATDSGLDSGVDGGCAPLPDVCGMAEICGNGSNDDCDMAVDEGCPCEPGAVQDCFLGAPGRRDVGACQDGSQVCGSGGTWGACEGGVLPDDTVCTGRDDLCNGCSDERICGLDCPSPGDPRVPVGQPFADYVLNGRDFYVGPARAWRWRIEGGPCDELSPRLESFELRGPSSEVATFVPKLSGDYRVTLSVTTPAGDVLSCSWEVNVAGPGLRVEMCYPESETQDLDLFLHRPGTTTAWYPPRATAFEPLPEASCGWHNCEAEVRLRTHPVTGRPVSRANWGYEESPLSACENGPAGDRWRARGSCANPRLDIDNNLSGDAIGLPENINVDNPNDGETFRIMVQNFSGVAARPVVNVYCGGRRISTFGRAPDTVTGYTGPDGNRAIGAMWRVADVTVRVNAAGETVGCDVRQLHPSGVASGYFVTVNDPSF